MIAPLTLFLLVTAPITAPAPAPIAASRFVCFSVTVRGSDATVDEPLLLAPELEPLDRCAVLVERCVVAVCETSPLDVRVTGAGVAAGAVVNALPRSTAEMLSSDVF